MTVAMNKTMGWLATALWATALLAGPPAAQAAYILDTGTPTTLNNAALKNSAAAGVQHLGVTFNVTQAASITSVEGHVGTATGGDLVFELHQGASPTGTLLFSSTVSVSAFTLDWLGATGLDWDVAAGDYTLTVIAQSGFQGYMRYGPPSPAGAEWAFSNAGTWGDIGSSNNLGWRVAADPAAVVAAPGTLALAGLGLVGLALIRRRQAG